MALQVPFLLVHLGVKHLPQEFLFVEGVDGDRFGGGKFLSGLFKDAVIV